MDVSSRTNGNAPEPLRHRAGLGPLEARLLELLWARPRAATVRELQRACAGLAYTTIMTTLDRLYRKRLLLRHRAGLVRQRTLLKTRVHAVLADRGIDATAALWAGPGRQWLAKVYSAA